jgi:hypothetical protein
VNQADDYVVHVRGLIQRKNTQEVIDKKDESICELERFTSNLYQSNIFSFLGNCLKGLIKFKKGSEISTGEHILGYLCWDENPDDSCLAKEQGGVDNTTSTTDKGNPIPKTSGFTFCPSKQPESKGNPIPKPSGFTFSSSKQPESKGNPIPKPSIFTFCPSRQPESKGNPIPKPSGFTFVPSKQPESKGNPIPKPSGLTFCPSKQPESKGNPIPKPSGFNFGP